MENRTPVCPRLTRFFVPQSSNSLMIFFTGKPSDMWALGVVFYTMLYGQFPFYDSSPTQLFNKIKAVDYSFPWLVFRDSALEAGTNLLYCFVL